MAAATVLMAIAVLKQTNFIGVQTDFIGKQTALLSSQTEAVKEQTKSLIEQTLIVKKQFDLYISITRPILSLEPVRSQDLAEWAYQIRNNNSIPANILFHDTKIEIDGSLLPTERLTHISRIIHQNDAPSYTVKVKLPSSVAKELREKKIAKTRIFMAACIVYGSAIENDPQIWLVTAKDFYDQYIANFLIQVRDSRQVSANTKKCKAELSRDQRGNSP